jgi:hypothetical protein
MRRFFYQIHQWMAENYNSGLFDAMSLAVTHFWNSDS